MSTQFQSKRSPREGKSEGAQLRTEFTSCVMYPLFRMFQWRICGIMGLATSRPARLVWNPSQELRGGVKVVHLLSVCMCSSYSQEQSTGRVRVVLWLYPAYVRGQSVLCQGHKSGIPCTYCTRNGPRILANSSLKLESSNFRSRIEFLGKFNVGRPFA